MSFEAKWLANDEEWLRLISKLGDKRAQLERAFLNEFDGTVMYDGKVPRAEILTLVQNTMRMYLVLLSGEELPKVLAQLPAELGQRRAKQGVPIELLLEGVRANSRVFWNAVRQEANATGDLACIVRNTGALLNLVEWHLGEAQRAYLLEASRLRMENASIQRQMLKKLLLDKSLTDTARHQLCTNLGLATEAKYELYVSLDRHSPDCKLCTALGEVFVFDDATRTCHFRTMTTVHRTSVAENSYPVAYIANIPGVKLLGDALDIGTELLRKNQGRKTDSPVTLHNMWGSVAWHALSDTVPRALLPLELDEFFALPEATKKRLVETAQCFVDTGSIKEVSEQLFCHRNTVVKRLARLENMLHLSFSKPRELALITIFLTSV